jgi:hypothetical protein
MKTSEKFLVNLIYILFNGISSIFCENPFEDEFGFINNKTLLLFCESLQSQGQNNSTFKIMI